MQYHRGVQYTAAITDATSQHFAADFRKAGDFEMSKKKVLIIGGVACGAKAAARLARLAPEFDITVLERGEHLSVAGCGFQIGRASCRERV